MIRWRLLIGSLAALLLVACSRDLGGDGQPGSGTGQGGGSQGGFAGTASSGIARGGSGGTGGAAGRGGTGGTGGLGGTGGIGGVGGGGGATMLATCAAGTPTFNVCVVSDADLLPLPYSSRDSIMAAAATVESVGTGAAPAQCGSARVFGAATSSDWWVQLRTADTVLWTIGVGGLGNAAVVKTGDHVTLDLDYQRTRQLVATISTKAAGRIQLSDAAGTPLLWAGSGSYGGTWLSLASGQPICDITTWSIDCLATRYEVIATINGSVATLAPFSAQYVGGYYLAVGENDVDQPLSQTGCAMDGPPLFAAAAVKAP